MQKKLMEEQKAMDLKIININEELVEYNTYSKLNKRIAEKESELLKIKMEIEKSREIIKETLSAAKSLYDELLVSTNKLHFYIFRTTPCVPYSFLLLSPRRINY